MNRTNSLRRLGETFRAQTTSRATLRQQRRDARAANGGGAVGNDTQHRSATKNQQPESVKDIKKRCSRQGWVSVCFRTGRCLSSTPDSISEFNLEFVLFPHRITTARNTRRQLYFESSLRLSLHFVLVFACVRRPVCCVLKKNARLPASATGEANRGWRPVCSRMRKTSRILHRSPPE